MWGEKGQDLCHPRLCDVGQAWAPQSCGGFTCQWGYCALLRRGGVQGLGWGLKMMCAVLFIP